MRNDKKFLIHFPNLKKNILKELFIPYLISEWTEKLIFFKSKENVTSQNFFLFLSNSRQTKEKVMDDDISHSFLCFKHVFRFYFNRSCFHRKIEHII